MGNCCTQCLRLFYRRKVLREYTSLDARPGGHDEDATLFDDDIGDGLMSPSTSQDTHKSAPPAITENEKLLLKSKNYAAFISSQKTFDDEIDKQLAAQEERLKKEEEELIKMKRDRNRTQTPETSDPWSSADNTNWNTAGGDEDFDMFLDSIANRERRAKETVDDEINEDDFVNGFTGQ